MRTAGLEDVDAIVSLRERLWPGSPEGEHETEVRAILDGTPRSTLPLTLIVAEVEGEVVGVVEVGLRSHADGCDPSRPVGFVEGWYILPRHRRKGIGSALISSAESWSREQGCTELASDTRIENDESQRAHEALGFEVVDRCVNYRKGLGS
ncbi:MAG: GNAT family N-acetyltransferase [Acidobacteriota bacterium]|nr:GNAT family N-acetyltransferase [Acidobacteriota bacterium]